MIVVPNPRSNKGLFPWWLQFLSLLKNATVYRNVNVLTYGRESDRGLPEFGYWYNAVANKKDCVLFPINERTKEKWRAFRKRQNLNNFGFGQSNMWYAREESSQEFVSRLIKNIESTMMTIGFRLLYLVVHNMNPYT